MGKSRTPGRAKPALAMGHGIRTARESRGMSRKELARRAELSYSYLSEIENGAKAPSSRALFVIADALGITASALLQLSEQERDRAPIAMSMRPDAMRATLSAARDSLGLLLDRRRELSGRPRPPAAQAGRIPEPLLAAITGGTCVAFVGAGFSGAAGLPGWGTLLSNIADDAALPDDLASHVSERVEHGTAHAFDEAAQLLEDEIGRPALLAALRTQLDPAPPLPHAMQARITHLRGIPFQAILTTNFDGVLEGDVPDSDAYREALRRDPTPWWTESYWAGGSGALTLKLHGDLATGSHEVVLTRRDYRRRLYEDPAYQTFLRSVMATRTVLYMGFSFEDAYLNELRSEVLALVGHRPDSAPVSYAIASDVPAATQRHFRANEGIEILSYDTHTANGGRDYSGFDAYLAEIYQQTNPGEKFARHLQRRRILWIDPHPENNELAFDHLRAAAKLSGNPTSLDLAANADEGIEKLREPGAEPFDLVISHWGDGQATDGADQPGSTAVALLTRMRERDLRAPVLIFASGKDADARKRTALSLGAQAYCFRFSGLFREIDRVLAPAEETG